MTNVRGLPGTDPEPYVTRVQLAGMMGVSVSTIDNWTREGMPSETWGMRARRFQPSRCIAWARARTGNQKAAA
jgi:phage terminase Nu1 subunit (DNA packaging protein)